MRPKHLRHQDVVDWDVDELDEESNETHDQEPDCGGLGHLHELCADIVIRRKRVVYEVKVAVIRMCKGKAATVFISRALRWYSSQDAMFSKNTASAPFRGIIHFAQAQCDDAICLRPVTVQRNAHRPFIVPRRYPWCSLVTAFSLRIAFQIKPIQNTGQ